MGFPAFSAASRKASRCGSNLESRRTRACRYCIDFQSISKPAIESRPWEDKRAIFRSPSALTEQIRFAPFCNQVHYCVHIGHQPAAKYSATRVVLSMAAPPAASVRPGILMEIAKQGMYLSLMYCNLDMNYVLRSMKHLGHAKTVTQ